ncbi:hypothetical protein NM688_g6176 [Phlebia brevispora]|uniref:Uncharacterized protein n=1 Tax=Phlebia brevispora TaxID=194682 RepID=A0ACC1SJ54_9APHY|nr:hypothetical protein NM688_g6176 [Phlebia brevispora]
MPRKKAAPGAGKSRGRQPHFVGAPQRLLQCHAEEWKTAKNAGDEYHKNKAAIANFYSRVTNLYFHLVGWNRPVDQPLPDDAELPAPSLSADLPENMQYTEAEKEAHKAEYDTMRTKIRAWYLHHCTKSNGDNTPKKNKLIEALTATKRQRSTLIHFYMSTHWDRIKPRVVEEQDCRLQAFNEAQSSTDDSHAAASPPAWIKTANEVANIMWNEETDAFRAQTEKEWDDEWAEEVHAREEASRTPRTPEEFHRALSEAAPLLQNLVDEVSQRLELATSLLIGGPIPEKGGMVSVRRFVFTSPLTSFHLIAPR